MARRHFSKDVCNRQIQKKAQEIRALRLSNARIEQEIHAEAQKERDEGVAEITLKISQM